MREVFNHQRSVSSGNEEVNTDVVGNFEDIFGFGFFYKMV